MVFLLGLLGFFQAAFLPGILLINLFKIKGSGLERFVYAFGLSLVFNYLLVLGLVTIGIYTQPVMLALFVVESGWLLWLKRGGLSAPLSMPLERWLDAIQHYLSTLVAEISGTDQKNRAVVFLRNCLYTIIIILTVYTLYVLIFTVQIPNLGTVFNQWDTVVSWNREAVQWAKNMFPTRTSEYPQLVPISFSVTYVFMKNPALQAFAKAIMPFYTLAMLLMALDLGMCKKRIGYFAAVILTYLILKKFLGYYIPDGYADIPAAFFAFISIYVLLKNESTIAISFKDRSVLLGAVLAGGAAVTKQTGLYMLAAYPALLFLMVFLDRKDTSFWEKLKPALAALAVIIIMAAPWYVYKEISFKLGVDESHIGLVYTNFTESGGANTALIPRMKDALLSMEKYLGLVLLLVPLFFFLPKNHRWISLVMVFPYTLLWAAFLGYDPRNLALAMPFISLCAGMAMGGLLEWLFRVGRKIELKRVRVAWVAVPLVLLVMAVALSVKNEAFIKNQIDQQKQIFAPNLNAELYSLLEKTGPDVKILTNYPINYLPGLENRQASFIFKDYDEFLSLLKDPSIRYILVPGDVRKDITQYIDQKIADGMFKFIFEDHGWIPYRLIDIHPSK